MNSPQLRLFPAARPLTERLGKELFRTIPNQPGVYSMFDALERLIYVGQSQDLRKRVGSYRYVNPDRSSRRLVRLVHGVERISWEVCESAEAARLRENHLLRTHRPKFNSLNTYPKAHVFIGLKRAPDFFGFCYTRELVEQGTPFSSAHLRAARWAAFNRCCDYSGPVCINPNRPTISRVRC